MIKNSILIKCKSPICKKNKYIRYEITDVKKSNVKHFSIVAFKVNWNYELDNVIEYICNI